MSSTTELDKEIDEILDDFGRDMYLAEKDNFSTSAVLQEKQEITVAAKSQIKDLILKARLEELENVYGDGTLHHHRVAEFIRKRKLKLRAELGDEG